MKFHEFGIENEKSLVLLHGVDTTWKISFGKFIELAQKEYHIIAVAEDGFNSDEPDIDAVSVTEEARKVTEYLIENGIIVCIAFKGVVAFIWLLELIGFSVMLPKGINIPLKNI